MRRFLFILLFFGLTQCVLYGQPKSAPPSVVRTQQRQFAIPYEIRPINGASAPKEVELLYTKDNGTNWHIYARQNTEKGAFHFQSDSGGEFWFLIRAVGTDGIARNLNAHQPITKVIIETPVPAIFVQQPLSPPEIPPQPTKPPVDAPSLDFLFLSPSPAEAILAADPMPLVDPIGFSFADKKTYQEEKLQQAVTEKFEPPIEIKKAGKIEFVSLEANVPQPYIVLEWNIGDADWTRSTVSVFRSQNKNGPWKLIAEKLDNTGKYSWYISAEDLNPFFLRIEAVRNNDDKHFDTSTDPIKIDPVFLRRK